VAFAFHAPPRPAISRKIHTEFTPLSPPKPLGCVTLRTVPNCGAVAGLAPFDKSASIVYNAVNVLVPTKANPSEDGGAKPRVYISRCPDSANRTAGLPKIEPHKRAVRANCPSSTLLFFRTGKVTGKTDLFVSLQVFHGAVRHP
jgi:hypothetical protein